MDTGASQVTESGATVGAWGLALRRLVWLLVLAAVLAGGVLAYRQYRAHRAAQVPRYFAVPASVGSVDVTVSGTGTVQAVTTQAVTPLVAGRVAKVDVTLGQTVHAGQPLVELADTSGLAQQVAAAQATLAQAQAQLDALLHPTANQDPRSIAQAQLKVQQAQVTLQQAQLTLSRDQANAAQNAAVTTPVAGTVLSVSVVNGQQVGAGAPIATVQPAGTPTVTVPVPEEDLPYLPIGTKATIAVPALQQTLTGTVTARAATPSGQIAVNSAGMPVSGAAASNPAFTQQALYALTVSFDQAPSGVPQGAAVLVTFQPQGSPPATYGWSDTGTITYPNPVTVTAQQAGTVQNLVAVGTALQAGQPVATILNANTQAQIQQDELNVRQDEIALQQAQLSLDQLQNPQPPTQDQIAAQQAAVQSAAQALAQKQQQLAQLTVTAPVDGKVVAVNVNPGDNVGTNTAVVQLQAAGALQVVAPIDELDVGKVKLGMPVQVVVNAFPDVPYTGKVAAIAPTAQTQNGVSMFPVTISLDNAQNLLPGMSATAIIQVAHADRTLRVPAQAVTLVNGNRGVVRVLEGGRPVPVQVTVGLVGSDWVQILSGLQPGQPVVAGQASTGSTNVGALFRGLGGGFGGGFGRPGGGGGAPAGRGGGGGRG
jgi:HlyD family secretion protein